MDEDGWGDGGSSSWPIVFPVRPIERENSVYASFDEFSMFPKLSLNGAAQGVEEEMARASNGCTWGGWDVDR